MDMTRHGLVKGGWSALGFLALGWLPVFAFEAAVWRGETAYVAIPEAVQDKAESLVERCSGGDVSLTLLRFDEVKYDLFERFKDEEDKMRARVTGKGSVPEVCREWKKGDAAKPTMVKVVVSPGAKPGKYAFGPLELAVVDRVLPPAKDCKTTFYVCASAMCPNTFVDSPCDEGFWLGAYPGVSGFDGFLRWAANSWPKDPYKDASFKTVRRGNLCWRPGDTFLVYPGGELSPRLIALRAGVVAAEKFRILREAGVDVSKKSAELAAKYGYRDACAGKTDFSAFRREVEAFVN